MSERLLFLIPARGGSKGLPGKNLREVGGLPLVGRAARLGCAAARSLGSQARVVCSTDDEAIADAARSWGAEVPFVRPATLSSDSARTIDVVFHTLDELRAEFDAVVLLQPTSPLTDVDDVIGAVRLRHRSGNPVVSVCPAEHPAEWLFTMDGNGSLRRLLETEALPTQRQAARVSFRVNGAVYVCSPGALRQHDSFLGPETRGFLMPAARSIDVDTELDLTIARAIASTRTVRSVAVGRRSIASDQPCYVIASLTLAAGSPVLTADLVTHIATAGADAIAVQGEHASAIDDAAAVALLAQCRAHDLPVIATIRDQEDCDRLTARTVDGLKLAPGALDRYAFLRRAAQTMKPLFVPTGDVDLSSIAKAVDVIEDAGCRSFVLLDSLDRSRTHDHGALDRLTTLRQAFGVPVGLSACDDNDARAGAATILGASVLEQYVSLSPSPAFGRMIRHVRDIATRRVSTPTPS